MECMWSPSIELCPLNLSTTTHMMRKCKKMALMQFADNAGPDQPDQVQCPLAESMDNVVYVDGQKMFRSD